MPYSQAQREWIKNKYEQVHLYLHSENDSDILGKLSSVDNKQGYIKELIRKDIGTFVEKPLKQIEKVIQSSKSAGRGKGLIDLTGQKFGKWTVLHKSETKQKGMTLWRCQCQCGHVQDIASTVLRSKYVPKCELCEGNQHKKGRQLIDLSGQVFGMWKVLNRDEANDKIGKTMWECKCLQCGKVFSVNSQALRTGKSKACRSCSRKNVNHPHKDGNTEIRRKDGKPTKIYRIWRSMKYRCNNPESKDYKNYGGRGITVCDEWNNDFMAFYNHVSALEHYGEKGRTMDRIDNEKGYYPGNIRWATGSEQEHNKRKYYSKTQPE